MRREGATAKRIATKKTGQIKKLTFWQKHHKNDFSSGISSSIRLSRTATKRWNNTYKYATKTDNVRNRSSKASTCSPIKKDGQKALNKRHQQWEARKSKGLVQLCHEHLYTQAKMTCSCWKRRKGGKVVRVWLHREWLEKWFMENKQCFTELETKQLLRKKKRFHIGKKMCKHLIQEILAIFSTTDDVIISIPQTLSWSGHRL